MDGASALTFQFHKGTIRTPTSGAMPGSYRNFNSIKVRLELNELRGAQMDRPISIP